MILRDYWILFLLISYTKSVGAHQHSFISIFATWNNFGVLVIYPKMNDQTTFVFANL